jgi:hypothetical protein
VAVLVVAVAVFFFAMAGIGLAGRPDLWVLVWALLGIGLLYWYFRQREMRRRAELARTPDRVPEWEAAMQVWERLWYCSRDNTAFDPERKRWLPVQAIYEYVYSRAAHGIVDSQQNGKAAAGKQ